MNRLFLWPRAKIYCPGGAACRLIVGQVGQVGHFRKCPLQSITVRCSPLRSIKKAAELCPAAFL